MWLQYQLYNFQLSTWIEHCRAEHTTWLTRRYMWSPKVTAWSMWWENSSFSCYCFVRVCGKLEVVNLPCVPSAPSRAGSTPRYVVDLALCRLCVCLHNHLRLFCFLSLAYFLLAAHQGMAYVFNSTFSLTVYLSPQFWSFQNASAKTWKHLLAIFKIWQKSGRQWIICRLQ